MLNEDGQEVARGLTTMSSEKISDLVGLQSSNQQGSGGSPVVVHRDALVLMMATSQRTVD
jgi:glutamate 5-kinase